MLFKTFLHVEGSQVFNCNVQNLGTVSKEVDCIGTCSKECIDLFCKCECHGCDIIISIEDFQLLQEAKLQKLIEKRKQINFEIKITKDYISRDMPNKIKNKK